MKNLIRSGLKNIKNEWVIFNWKNTQNYWSLYVNNNFFCIYKIFNITKETGEKYGIEVIVDSVNALWLTEQNIEEKLGHKNLPAISNKYSKIYKKGRYDLVNKPIK